ncbi:MAG: hypothetical protein LBS46_05620 [Dysgonamonadaceae bacterium]|jgi:hypothetical protein|nr:hypothetical protein [Dysgonamonadaceae bacterium]
MTTQSLSFVFAAFLTAVVFSFSSCSEDEGGFSASGKASLRISVAGISAGGEESLTRAALEPQTVFLTADDGTPVEFTLSVDPASVTRATNPMGTGKKYRVIVYKNANTYVTEAEFTAGTDGSITGLEQDIPYKLVAFSYNTATALSAVNSATTLTVDPSYDLLHWVGSVTIASGSPSPTVAIIFKHRFPKVTVTADASLTGDNITTVPASATLTPGYKGQLTLLTDGDPAATGTASAQTFTFNTSNNNMVAASNTTRYVFTGNDNPITLAFSGTLIVNASGGNKTLTNPVVHFASVLQSGHSYTLTMRVEASKGDYYPYAPATGSTYEVTIPLGTTYSYTNASGTNTDVNSLTFLRYNLGADPDLSPKAQMAYPHTDDKNIRVYGGLFQWGRKDVYHALRDAIADVPGSFTSTQYTFATYNPASTSQQFVWKNSLTKGWWLSNDDADSNLWGNGGGLSEQTNFSYNSVKPITTSANSYNPCPTGYRVPTEHEWALIINESGNSASSYNDHFMAASPYTNTSSYGNTWYVPYYNQNVVWVRVSDKKASTDFTGNKMNGYALYNATDAAIDTYGKRNSVFAPDTDLTDGSAPNPLMFLPAAGLRDYTNAGVAVTGSAGCYWSSTINNNTSSSYNMFFTNIIVNADNPPNRANGVSVRCIKE